MPLTVHTNAAQYQFDGPYTSPDEMGSKSGVYVITTKTAEDRHRVLDVGESGDLSDRLTNHERSGCWRSHEQQGIHMWCYYCEESERMEIETMIREAHNPPCGMK